MGTEKEARHKFPVITVRLQQFSTYSTQCKMRNTIFGRYIRQQREKMYGPQISNEQSAAAAAEEQQQQQQLQRRRGGVVFRIFHPVVVVVRSPPPPPVLSFARSSFFRLLLLLCVWQAG